MAKVSNETVREIETIFFKLTINYIFILPSVWNNFNVLRLLYAKENTLRSRLTKTAILVEFVFRLTV